MASNSVQKQVGQLVIAGFRSQHAKEDSDVYRFISEYNVGGVILYDEDLDIGGPGTRNIHSQEQVKDLTSSLQSLSDTPLLISVDQEGGKVHRLRSLYGFPETPSWKYIGLLNDYHMTMEFSKSIAQTLAKAGVNLNFAPVLDIDYGIGTVISDSERSFSSDPEMVAQNAKLFIDEHRKNNVITCSKHFPGIGSASRDTHEGFTDISDTWSVKDMIPFERLISANYADMLMISHAFNKELDKMYPASLSQLIVHDMLRTDLGFSGPIICDDPSMRAISDHFEIEDAFELMLNAGIDLFCLGNNLIYDSNYIPNVIETIIHLVEKGKIKFDRILESIQRVDKVKAKYNIYE